MQILALSPYHGGSHQAFFAGWSAHSEHDFEFLTLPARHWKWRMRHAAISMAEQLASLQGTADLIVCTDMLNLAEFRGLLPARYASVPAIAYFHENQWTYPARRQDPRDLHFAMTNFSTAVAADQVWFNSRFHRDAFLAAAGEFFTGMPDNQLRSSQESVARKSVIQYPGIDDSLCAVTSAASEEGRSTSHSGSPLVIAWVSRWEHDKNPIAFFASLEDLAIRKIPFQLVVLGESFREIPECFATARRQHDSAILQWGFVQSRREYCEWLRRSDVVVSTANHEFFGIGIVEAVAAGCYPLVPNRLSYPEVLGLNASSCYSATAELPDRLTQFAALKKRGSWPPETELVDRVRSTYGWTVRAAAMDRAADELVRGQGPR